VQNPQCNRFDKLSALPWNQRLDKWNGLCERRFAVMTRLNQLTLTVVFLLLGCGDSTTSATGTMSEPPVDDAVYALRVRVAFVEDGEGVAIRAQNDAFVHIPATEIIGKKLVWATTTGGEPISTVLPMEIGNTIVRDDLTAEYQTSARYGNGPWEMAAFVSIAGASPLEGPQPGDLAAFENDPPPAGQPPVTGVSVRMTVDYADAEVTLGNQHFIQY
jgi:hypothetical protein